LFEVLFFAYQKLLTPFKFRLMSDAAPA